MGLPERSLSLNPGLCLEMDEEAGAVHCLWRHRPNPQCSLRRQACFGWSYHVSV